MTTFLLSLLYSYKHVVAETEDRFIWKSISGAVMPPNNYP